MTKLKANDPAPAFTLKDQDGNPVSLADFSGKKLLIFFYPKADTPGCTTQACAVSEAIPDFSSLDLNAIGISPDKPEKQKKFAQKHNLSIRLLADEDHCIAEAYGAWGEKSMYGKKYLGIIRSAFLIDESGNITEAFYKVSPKDTVPKVKKAIQAN